MYLFGAKREMDVDSGEYSHRDRSDVHLVTCLEIIEIRYDSEPRSDKEHKNILWVIPHSLPELYFLRTRTVRST